MIGHKVEGYLSASGTKNEARIIGAEQVKMPEQGGSQAAQEQEQMKVGLCMGLGSWSNAELGKEIALRVLT